MAAGRALVFPSHPLRKALYPELEQGARNRGGEGRGGEGSCSVPLPLGPPLGGEGLK